MLRTDAVVRTVWSQELEVSKKQGATGDYDSKQILFRVATDRNYKVTRTVNGQQVSERPTDFILCRATGSTAQVFADNCTAKDKEGKLISRHLYLIGHIETYRSPRKFPVQATVNYNGQLLNISLETEAQVDGHIFVVDEIEFLDSKPREVSTVAGATVANVTVVPAQTATPVQNVAPVQNTAPVQNVVPNVGTPVQVVGQPIQMVYSNPIAGAMNEPIPSVSTDFNTQGESAPF
jgi:hypothetical protein